MNNKTSRNKGNQAGKASFRKDWRQSLLILKAIFLCFFCWLMLSGCNTTTVKREFRPTLDLSEINQNIEREGTRSGVLEAEESHHESEKRPAVKKLSFPGEEQKIAPPAPGEFTEDIKGGQGILLNFNNADIYEFIKVVSEVLNINYIIDPRVKGTVNIHSGQEIPPSKLYPVFKKILHINGLDIRSEKDYYYIHMAEKASPEQVYGPGKMGKLNNSPRQVIQVIPLSYIPASEAMKLLQPYLSEQGDIFSLASLNMLVINGYESKVRDALRILAKIDTAAFSSMEVQLVRVDEAPVSKLQEELDEILKAMKVNEELPSVQVIPLSRVNSLLLIGNNKKIVNMAKSWIDELDTMPTFDRDNIYVYNVRNSVASGLAELVRQLVSEEKPEGNISKHVSKSDEGKLGGETQVRKVSGGDGGPPISSLRFKGNPVIFADDDRNIILIRGLAPDYKRIVKILERLDTLPRQVLVEVVLAELTLTDELSLGVEWAFHNNNISKNGQNYRQDFISNFAGLAFNGGGAPGFTYALSKGEDVYGLLQSLASKNDVSVLSSPQLLVLNNETASINVGRQVPIVTTETQNDAGDSINVVDKTVQYKDTGVILEVTPQINYNGIILLDIKQNVSDALENTSSGIDSPEISQRELKTKLAVKDGQSILMGGLIDQTDAEVSSGVPFLMNLPGLGFLFKFKRDVQEKTELLIMITPYVIESEDVLDQYIGEFEKKMELLRDKFIADEQFQK